MLLEYVQSVTGTYELIIYIQFIANHLRLCSRTQLYSVMHSYQTVCHVEPMCSHLDLFILSYLF